MFKKLNCICPQWGILCSFVSLLSIAVNAQSFEKLTIDHLTTTPTASRSANFVDVNGDGWDDIFFSNGPSSGQNNMLYLNNQDGTFTTVLTDDIVLDNDRSDGASFADVDNDGDLDAFVVTYGGGGIGKKNYFYRNQGNGVFDYEENAAMSGLLTYSEMANWVDLNNDQFLDLYFTNSRVNLQNIYFENQGDGSFLQKSNLSVTAENLKSRSVDWVDYDNDGDSDLFITNEEGGKNSLFRNDGPDNFVQIDNLPFVADTRNSAGSSWADIDNDGDLDLFIANYNGEKNQLFLNEAGNFEEQIDSEIAAVGGGSFGSAFGDLDNDGDVDLIVCNAYFSGQNKNSIYINDGYGEFHRDSTSALALQEGYSFGCGLGDFNNDGWLDVILANTFSENQANALFENTGSGNNWIKINCRGNASNASAVGAKLKITTTIDGEVIEQHRHISAASGYCSQNSFTNHFGLGDAAAISELQIEWPSGAFEIFNNLQANVSYLIEEGNGILLNENQIIHPAQIRIFPNPSDDKIFIELKESFQGKAFLELFDQKGSRVTNGYFEPSNIMELSKGDLPTGAYFLKITIAEKILSSKLIFR